MALTRAQAAIWQKARIMGNGGQAVSLTDDACAYLVARIVCDLGLKRHFRDLPSKTPSFFSQRPLEELTVSGIDAKNLFERLVRTRPDADTYFACLAKLHKARLKYARILSTQPFPTLEQVGPRGLLQYGKLSSRALGAFLYWRKWFFDIDNRAGQETGYLFEPIIAAAIGGVPAPAATSPVKRHRDPSRGRQVDCLLNERAYEFKIRITIAASGQGRWQEETDFPIDCRESGFVPVFVCMDSTANPKLEALVRAFQDQGGEVFVGQDAWSHLDACAGDTMSKFLELYVRKPIQDLLDKTEEKLPNLLAKCAEDSLDIKIGDDLLHIPRLAVGAVPVEEEDTMPPDAGDDIPG